tara:strand:- start:16133 stop:16399 length:267 start_codon:yes stop_codon:yes gene_type:complete
MNKKHGNNIVRNEGEDPALDFCANSIIDVIAFGEAQGISPSSMSTALINATCKFLVSNGVPKILAMKAFGDCYDFSKENFEKDEADDE